MPYLGDPETMFFYPSPSKTPSRTSKDQTSRATGGEPPEMTEFRRTGIVSQDPFMMQTPPPSVLRSYAHKNAQQPATGPQTLFAHPIPASPSVTPSKPRAPRRIYPDLPKPSIGLNDDLFRRGLAHSSRLSPPRSTLGSQDTLPLYHDQPPAFSVKHEPTAFQLPPWPTPGPSEQHISSSKALPAYLAAPLTPPVTPERISVKGSTRYPAVATTTHLRDSISPLDGHVSKVIKGQRGQSTRALPAASVFDPFTALPADAVPQWAVQVDQRGISGRLFSPPTVGRDQAKAQPYMVSPIDRKPNVMHDQQRRLFADATAPNPISRLGTPTSKRGAGHVIPSPRIKRADNGDDQTTTPVSVGAGITAQLFSAGLFSNGHRLKFYQAIDLRKLIQREKGEMVCNDTSENSVGYILAYQMGYGKTPTSIALIAGNPAPVDFQGRRATLVVTPNQGIMDHWESEIEKFAPHLKVHYYNSINCSFREFDHVDVVLCTYAQVRNQLKNDLSDPGAKAKAPLFVMRWFRVIADESQTCRNPDTQCAAALWAVPKKHGLCLSGTPAQNSPRDYYFHFRFLGVNYQGINDLHVFDRMIYSKRQKGPIVNARAKNIMDTVIADFCIFREKTDPRTGKDLIDLPPRTDKVVEFELTEQEQAVYEYVNGLKGLVILAKITRLRQVCDHPSLISTVVKTMDSEGDFEGVDAKNHPAMVAPRSLPRSLGGLKDLFDEDYISSKLIEMYKILASRPPGHKAIIFTHFTAVIPSIVNVLEQARIGWVQYTGDMSAKQRAASLKSIADDDKCSVIIVSISAGGVGLNIISCNTVIILEPWWNPYVEEQAITRAYRIGQTLPVKVYRLKAADSIEGAIVKTQAMKLETIRKTYESAVKLQLREMEAWLRS